MGSEHYCLRWSNHQSNLLGVFSQLLQDESLVDVTLACSEGASIRAHKVVLSACSSYFQSLFLDHPEKHPIVILKDVRLSELQTLVEFMYKGEVNVQYCQLSALLKTAESLKVKGLAEMTNQNTALREPEREPDRLRSSHSQQSNTGKSSSVVSIAAPTSTAATASSSICDPQCSMETSTSNLGGSGNISGSTICGVASLLTSQQQQQSQISTNSNSNLASISTSNSNFSLGVKRENDRCSPSPPKRLHSSAPSSSPLPLDLYQRRCPSNRSDRHRRMDDDHDLLTSSIGGNGSGGGGSSSIIGSGVGGRLSRTPTTMIDEQLSPSGSCGLMGDKEREKERDRNKHNNSTDDDDDDGGPNSIGINMTINSNSSNNIIPGGLNRDGISNRISNIVGSGGNDGGAGHSSSSQTVVVPPLNSSNTPTSSFHSTSDLRPSSRSGGGGGSLGSSTGNVNMTHTATSSGISSPIISTEPVAGPSGLGPVQSVPLSLKKEIDWERSDEKSGDTIDYRHSHDSETSESPHGVLGGVGTTSTTTINAPTGSGGNGGSSSSLEQNNPIYPCMYCCATFPHQSKLTRHILSHSLETLKYRETAHLLHSGHIANLMPHDLPPLPQHFTHRHGPPGSGLDTMDSTDTSTGHSQLDMELHAAAYAAAAAAQSLSGNVNLAGVNSAELLMGASSSSLLAAAAASSQSGLSGNQSGSSMLVGISNNNCGSGISGNNTISGNTNSSSAAVAAAVAAAASASSSSASATSDPNNVVLCKFCGKSFPDVASLITHLPVHTGDRPFKCEFCGKAFKLRHHMKDHCRVHTGERPFRCSMCGKTFSRSTILKAHEKTHFPKYVRKFLSTSPVDTKDELPQ